MITAEKIYKEILDMPIEEREKLFSVIARKGFEKDLYRHYSVYPVHSSQFTVSDLVCRKNRMNSAFDSRSSRSTWRLSTGC